MIRDQRWENVYASILPLPEDHPFYDHEGIVEFCIEIECNGKVLGSKILQDESLPFHNPDDLHKTILREMVDRLDKELKTQEEVTSDRFIPSSEKGCGRAP